MKPKNKFFFFLMLAAGAMAPAQSNTAVASGSIGKCAVWNYPYTLYNTSGASQTVGDGVTVTVDQDRNIGAVNLSGAGALSMSGSNGITLSGSGSEINCRWDANRSGNYSVVNNSGSTTANSFPLNTGTFFTAPYAGQYIWQLGSGWSASLSGAYLNGVVALFKDGTSQSSYVFAQSQSGTCGQASGTTTMAPTWRSQISPISLTANQTLSYRAGTGFSTNSSCNNTTLNFTLGNATMLYDN